MVRVLVYVLMVSLTMVGISFGQTTTTYVLSTANCDGYDRDGSLSNPPPAPSDASWQVIADTTSMETDDTSYKETKRTTARDQFDSQLFRFKVTEAVGTISKIDGTWIGYGENQATYSCYLYIWNNNSSAWELFQSQDIGAPTGTLTGNMTTNISYYIDGSGYVYFAAQAKHYNYTPSIALSSPGNGAGYDWVSNFTLTTTNRTDLDTTDTLETYINIRRSDNGWSSNSGWIAGLSWNVNIPSYGYWYYWYAQVRDGIATSSATAEWNFFADASKSCCPLIYVWDGSKYQYVTDSARSYSPGIIKKRRFDSGKVKRQFFPLELEYVVLGDNLPVRDGCYEVKFRESLNEITFIDEANLVFFEHPQDMMVVASAAGKQASEVGLEMIPNDEFYLVAKDRRLPLSARVEGGKDILSLVSKVDDKVAPIDGEEIKIVLDFGKVEGENANLVFEGWRYLYEGKGGPKEDTNIRRRGSIVECMGDGGNWEKVKEFGLFTGDFKTMVVPLGNVLNGRSDQRLRITLLGKQASRTVNMFDRITLDTTPRIELVKREIQLSKAELSYMGLANIENFNSPNGRMMADDSSKMVNPEFIHTGGHTRYGEVDELVLSSDNKMVVMGAGDQLFLRFKGLSGPVPVGMSRTFALRNSICFREGKEPGEIKTVDPLPYIGVKDYPYETDEDSYPMTASNLEYLRKYNTRVVTKEDVIAAEKAYAQNQIALARMFPPVPRSLNTDYCECKITYTAGPIAPSVPVLATPTDTATGVNPTVTLQWGDSSGTAPITYTLQVSTDSGFGTFVVNQGAIASSEYAASLNPSTQYWWKVKATNAAGDSAYCTAWSFTTGSLPSAPSLTAPSDAATDVSSTPSFTWAASTGTAPITYTIQVDTENGFGDPTTINQGSLAVTNYTVVSALNEGTVYYWRVRGTNSLGDGNWSSTRSFTTGAKPSDPVLSAPADASTKQLPVSFTWSASTGTAPITYNLLIDTADTFPSPDVNEGALATNSYSSSTLPIGTYYWKVKAANAVGNSNWSPVWSFTIDQNLAPSAPVLVSPADTDNTVDIDCNLLWEASTGTAPITYRIQIDTDFGFGTAAEYITTKIWQEITGLDFSTTYYWRVRGENIAGNGAWPTAFSFTTVSSGGGSPQPPALPSLSEPSDGAIDTPADLMFGWVPPATGTSPFTYTLQLALDDTFTLPVYSNPTITASYFTVEDLSNGMTYHWRVKATNDYGDSGWTASRSLTTVAAPVAPSVPVPSSPTDSATYQPSNPFLIWQASTGAAPVTYTVQWDTDSLLSSPEEITTTGLWCQPTDLVFNTTYYWHVKATNSVGASTWSTTWHFATTPTMMSPTTPNLPGMDDGTINVALDASIFWNAAVGTEPITYEVEVSENSDMSSALTYYTTELWVQPTGLQSSTVYHWRLKASNSEGSSDWTSTRSFTTAQELVAPGAPTLTSPTDAQQVLPIDPTLYWTASSGTAPITYTILVSQSSDFSSSSEYTTAATWHQLDALSYGVIYHWKVKGTNVVGAGPWSDAYSFVTINSADVDMTPAIPSAPALVLPAQAATGQPINVTFGWENSTGTNPITYEIQVSLESDFSVLQYTAGELAVTYKLINGFPYDTVVYWRVRGKNGFGTGDWSETASFTTISISESYSVPTTPEHATPLDASSQSNSSITFSWSTSYGKGAMSYQLQVSLYESFSSTLFNFQNITEAQKAVSQSFVEGKTYYWRVRASSVYGASDWSAPWSFTVAASTEGPGPTAPTVPADTQGEEKKPSACFLGELLK